MIRTLQAIDWGVLPPYPIALHRRVTAFVGNNGSGKSSAMDAIKAVLGATRFGQNRSASAYLNNGGGVHPPATDSFVFLCCEMPPARGLRFADEQGRFTLALWVTRTRRAFLALPGHLLLGIKRDLAVDLRELQERYPRRQWLRPEDYQAKVLDPLGATGALQRLMEIPQGETQRLLDARPDRLLRNLLGWMGALEPLEALDQRRLEAEAAQTERDRAERDVLREERNLAQAQRDLADDGRLAATQAHLEGLLARLRGAAAALEAALDAEREEAERQRQQALSALPEAEQALERAQQAQRAAAAAPDDWRLASEAATALAEVGARCEVVASVLRPDQATPQQVSALRHLMCAVIVADADWHLVPEVLEAHPQVLFLRGSDDPELVGSWWATQAPQGPLREVAGHVAVGEQAFVPRLDVSLPLDPSADDLVAQARSQVWACQRQVEEADRVLRSLESRRGQVEHALQVAGDGEVAEAEADELPGLLAEQRRVRNELVELAARDARQAERRRQLARQEARLAEAREFLSGQAGALEAAQQALRDARALYGEHVRRLVGGLDTHFRDLCEAASMRGELELAEDPLAEAGGRLVIRVADSPQGQLRNYHGEADLSGGWRAKTAVIMLMAAISAAGGDHALPVICLDEHSAALDEERVNELGWVFQQIARTRGLQFVCAMPTKKNAERISWTDAQIGFLKAAPGQLYAPLPHILEASDEATRPVPLHEQDGEAS